MCEHLGISTPAGKIVKGDDDSTIKENPLFCNLAPDFEDFSVLTIKKQRLKGYLNGECSNEYKIPSF